MSFEPFSSFSAVKTIYEDLGITNIKIVKMSTLKIRCPEARILICANYRYCRVIGILFIFGSTSHFLSCYPLILSISWWPYFVCKLLGFSPEIKVYLIFERIHLKETFQNSWMKCHDTVLRKAFNGRKLLWAYFMSLWK